MEGLRKKLLVLTGLFISGMNASWSNTLTTISSETSPIKPINEHASQANREVLYELSHPSDLSLPYNSKEVLIKTFQKIKLNQLETILINNNPTIKIYSEKINQAKSLLRNSLSLWYPSLNLTANGLPQYFESNNYNESSSIADTSSKQWSSSISAQVKWDLINPSRVPEIAAAKDTL